MSDHQATSELFLVSPETEVVTSPGSTSRRGTLVERILAGDEDAFNELYRAYAPMVHGIVLARVARDDVDDVLQEVFIAALRMLHTLRDQNAIGPWLAAIARNKAMNVYRNAKPNVELPEELPHTGDQRSIEADEIISVIRSLPDAYRETLVLRLVEGMTGPEIAERTGMKADSVRVNLHRGMKQLRERLGSGVK